jgi:hypothetical protein
MQPTEEQIEAAWQKYLEFRDQDTYNGDPARQSMYTASSYYCFKLAFLAGVEFSYYTNE